jgi:hypothetical protein
MAHSGRAKNFTFFFYVPDAPLMPTGRLFAYRYDIQEIKR